MHPIVLEQLARDHGEEFRLRAAHHRQVALVRRVSPAGRTDDVRLALAGVALRFARALDRDGRVVPTVAAR